MTDLKALDEIRDYTKYKKDLKRTLKRNGDKSLPVLVAERFEFADGRLRTLVLIGRLPTGMEREVKATGVSTSTGTCTWNSARRCLEGVTGVSESKVLPGLRDADIDLAAPGAGGPAPGSEAPDLNPRMRRRIAHEEQRLAMRDVAARLKELRLKIQERRDDPEIVPLVQAAIRAVQGTDVDAASAAVGAVERGLTPPAGARPVQEAPHDLNPTMARRMRFEEERHARGQAMGPILERLRALRDTLADLQGDEAVAERQRETVAAVRAEDAGAAERALARLEAAVSAARGGAPAAPARGAGGGQPAGGQQAPPPAQPQAQAQPQPPPPPAAQPPRPQPAAPPRVPSKFQIDFSEERIDTLLREVDRGGLKGTGDFGKLLKEAKKVLAAEGQPNTKRVPMLEEFICKAEAYMTRHTDAADPDAVTRKKIDAGTNLVREARKLLLDLVEVRDVSSTDPDKAAGHRAMKADVMREAYGSRRPGGGTSDVELVLNANGNVAYAFKSIEGETEQMGTPKGSGAVREALASAVADQVRAQSGLDFGFPKVSIGEIGGRTGALVEGLNGEMADDEEIAKLNDYDALEDRWRQAKARAEADGTPVPELEDCQIDTAPIRARAGQLVDSLPDREIQKVLLSNFATAQFDIKWGNVMVEDDGAGNVRARPFDAGAAFPTGQEIQNLIQRRAVPGAQLLRNPFTGADTHAANAPMDPELVRGFLAIDVKQLQNSITDERKRLAKRHGLDSKLLDNHAAARSLKSIKLVQKLLTQRPDMTTTELVDTFHARMGELV